MGGRGAVRAVDDFSRRSALVEGLSRLCANTESTHFFAQHTLLEAEKKGTAPALAELITMPSVPSSLFTRPFCVVVTSFPSKTLSLK